MRVEYYRNKFFFTIKQQNTIKGYEVYEVYQMYRIVCVTDYTNRLRQTVNSPVKCT